MFFLHLTLFWAMIAALLAGLYAGFHAVLVRAASGVAHHPLSRRARWLTVVLALLLAGFTFSLLISAILIYSMRNCPPSCL